jgi:hypothetical protein
MKDDLSERQARLRATAEFDFLKRAEQNYVPHAARNKVNFRSACLGSDTF